MTHPFDDEAMTYDIEAHRYVLDKDYFKSKTGVDLALALNPGFTTQERGELANTWLDELSESLYSKIYEFNTNNVMQEYWLAKVPSLRPLIRDAMVQQALYLLKNGDLDMYSGVDLKTGKIMDKNLIGQMAISPKAMRILNRQVPEIGVAITYQGTIYSPIGLAIREDY